MINRNRFNIDNFIITAKDLGFAELFIHCQNELKFLDGIRFTKTSPYKDIEWQVKEYRNFIHEFAYTLHTGNKPSGMKGEQFQKTKPIIESLVLKGHWKKEALNIYEPNTNN